jgi:phosphoesterase RecJ-like protein
VDSSRLRDLDALIRAHQHFLHVTHVNPDADGIGSALAMSRWLRQLGKTSRVVVPSPVPKRLQFLANGQEIGVATEASPVAIPGDAVVLVYDISTLSRLGVLEAPVRDFQGPRVVLDHHDGDVEFESLALVDPSAGATAQVVFEILEAAGVPLTMDLALPLYVALISDTGSFNYGKTSPRSHEMAARLLAAGVKPLDVHGQLEGTRSLASLRALGEVLAAIEIDGQDSRLAHATLPHDLLHNGGSEPLDAGDLVKSTISLEGVQAGVLFVQASPTSTRLSFRSKGDVSIVEIAKSLGGGGHRNAAGATVNEPIDRVRETVLARMRESLRQQLGPPQG